MIDEKKHYEKLKSAIKEERNAEIEATIHEIKNYSGKKREEKGRAILNLDGKISGYEIGGFTLIKYGRRKYIDTNISVGDEVLISKGDPLKSDYLATVTNIGNRYIEVAVSGNVPYWALKDTRIDLYFNDVTFTRMKEALFRFRNPEDNFKNLKKVLLEKKDPEKVKLEHDLELYDKNLNSFQKEAVNQSLSEKEIFLLYGPPGTGKTRTLSEIILQEAKRGNKVLASAESNIATDNLIEYLTNISNDFKIIRIGHPARVSEKTKNLLIYNAVKEKQSYKNAQKMREEMNEIIETRSKYKKPNPSLRRGMSDDQIKKYARNKKSFRGVSAKKLKSMSKWIRYNEMIDELYMSIKDLEEFALDSVIEESDIIVTTNATAGSDFLKNRNFDVSVIDEGSQSMEPSSLISCTKSEKLIMSGDHNQLPPTILSEKSKEVLSKTLFQRLINKYSNNSYMLRIQYRMNKEIMFFPNKYFYDGKLIADESVKNHTIKDLTTKTIPDDYILNENNLVLFLNTSYSKRKKEEQKTGSKSRMNYLEAEIIHKILEKFSVIDINLEKIGIISPYFDQIELIQDTIKDDFEKLPEISTVDGFQGREKEIIIISNVRSNEYSKIGFLKDYRRLNVSITRAKRKLIIIGDSETLIENENFKNLINYLREKELFYDITWG
ncbi:MAG: IGHMBP2 family helicase [Thermotogota bacterium]